jgi:hypothetical protein
MFVEIDDADRIRPELERLDGLHDAVRLEAGDAVCRARDIPPPDEGPTTHTVSVHFLGFDLSPEALAALRQGAPATLIADHPEYQAQQSLPAELVRLLLRDLGHEDV